MKKYFALLLFLAYSLTFSQKQKTLSTVNGDESNIVVNKNYKPILFGQRMKKYPFNKTTKVKIISYNLEFNKSNAYEPAPPPPKTTEDSIKLKEFYKRPQSIALKEIIGTQSEKGIIETTNLNFEEVSKLSHILYNTCNKYIINIRSQSGCFFPRNAILFYDENDKVFEIFEICFECENSESYPSKFLNWKNTCDQIYPELELFFKAKGLETQYLKNTG